jgi:hypothetical protein
MARSGTYRLEVGSMFHETSPPSFLRKPENTSLARATSFNQKDVTDFHDSYRELLVKFKSTGEHI